MIMNQIRLLLLLQSGILQQGRLAADFCDANLSGAHQLNSLRRHSGCQECQVPASRPGMEGAGAASNDWSWPKGDWPLSGARFEEADQRRSPAAASSCKRNVVLVGGTGAGNVLADFLARLDWSFSLYSFGKGSWSNAVMIPVEASISDGLGRILVP
jgi:hypothetical protein